MPPVPVIDAFIEAGSVSLEGSHVGGGLDEAEHIRRAHPDVVHATIHAAAVYGDDSAVAACLAADPASATAPGGSRGWDPLTYLCFSRYLRIDRDRSAAFVRAATLLLDAGASASTGFYEHAHSPNPEFESVLYGAAGVAHDASMTRLLLERGADPNDGEVTYHAPEWWDPDVIAALVESGRLSAESLATMLLRKHDWHDEPGVRYLLAHGADPNGQTVWGITPLQQAVRRDNAATIVEALLAHGADPTRPMDPRAAHGRNDVDAVALAAWRGRGDVLALFARAGVPMPDEGVLGMLVACARGEETAAKALAASTPEVRAACRDKGGEWLALAAGNGNVAALGCLLAIGVPVGSVWAEGDGYFGIAPASNALHVAAWRAQHDAVQYLLAQGAAIDITDGAGATPLQLAVRACTHSYWRDRRQPTSIAALLHAGADASSLAVPTGYDDADRLLSAARQRS
jgi:ankyrin repeat protein